ncbi:hypothetical protein NECID01_1541 [Nematocida sp. AWRm77]|nr:hypothetical protein NECID01_1541 [Nematocida sp. AWRm77]
MIPAVSTIHNNNISIKENSYIEKIKELATQTNEDIEYIRPFTWALNIVLFLLVAYMLIAGFCFIFNFSYNEFKQDFIMLGSTKVNTNSDEDLSEEGQNHSYSQRSVIRKKRRTKILLAIAGIVLVTIFFILLYVHPFPFNKNLFSTIFMKKINLYLSNELKDTIKYSNEELRNELIKEYSMIHLGRYNNIFENIYFTPYCVLNNITNPEKLVCDSNKDSFLSDIEKILRFNNLIGLRKAVLNLYKNTSFEKDIEKIIYSIRGWRSSL